MNWGRIMVGNFDFYNTLKQWKYWSYVFPPYLVIILSNNENIRKKFCLLFLFNTLYELQYRHGHLQNQLSSSVLYSLSIPWTLYQKSMVSLYLSLSVKGAIWLKGQRVILYKIYWTQQLLSPIKKRYLSRINILNTAIAKSNQ